MNTAVINLRVDPKVKAGAKAFANSLGLDLSTLIDNYLRYLLKAKAVVFTAEGAVPIRKMSERSEEELEKALKDIDKTIVVDDVAAYLKQL